MSQEPSQVRNQEIKSPREARVQVSGRVRLPGDQNQEHIAQRKQY